VKAVPKKLATFLWAVKDPVHPKQCSGATCRTHCKGCDL